jgi:hypothetical protein
MQPYDQMFGLQRNVFDFSYDPNNLVFWCDYGCEKKIKIKKHNVIYIHVWLWEKIGTLDM